MRILSPSRKMLLPNATARGLMDTAVGALAPPNSPVLSTLLAPALTLAGILPWIVPGIRIAVGFVQIINQMAFMAGLGALIRGYIFDARPDEHVIYVNQGYGKYGHSKHRPAEHY